LAALAGILATDPEIVVLDEPSAALDPRARRRVIEVLQALDKPMILAAHDLDMALDVCSRAVVMNRGQAAAEGELPALLKDEPLLRRNGLELPLRCAGSNAKNP
jgi:cobalt/nickel transport system ATP-binding protein